MPGELRTAFNTGSTLYALIWDFANNEIWYPTGEVFETWGTGSRSTLDYAITMTELVSGIGYYVADWPTGMSAGSYDYIVKYQAGSVPADSDVMLSGPVKVYWTGVTTAAEPETNAVNICNRALAKLGGGEDTRIISAIGTSGDKTSELCELLYTPTRKEVLVRVKPQECSEYEDLGDESSFSGEKAEWRYVFDLPDDCLSVIKQTDERYHKLEYDHEIKLSKLFTNALSNEDADSAYIEYVVNETDGSKFSESLINAIATKLASELAPRIIGGEWAWKRRLDLLDEYEKLVLPLAKGLNRRQQYHDERERESKYSILGDRYEYE